MARIGGSRRKRLGTFTKSSRQKGKISQTQFLRSYEIGDKVILKIEPGVQKAVFFPRFQGKVGVITKKQGTCYHVLIKDGNKEKEVITHPIHLIKQTA